MVQNTTVLNGLGSASTLPLLSRLKVEQSVSLQSTKIVRWRPEV